VIAEVQTAYQARTVSILSSEMGANPLWEMDYKGQRLAYLHPGVGAPLAAGFLEELIARGCRKFIVCGGAGVLNADLAVGHIVVPTSAIRDEGTSYHYLPPGDDAVPHLAGIEAIEATLRRHSVAYVAGKTWTTDAFYRETPDKVRRRREAGCLTVEMEAAAFFAVAQFRGVVLAQMLYSGDNLDGENWDSREWNSHSVRERLFWLAAEACSLL
jgi:uridine phosphorylase